MISSQGPDDSGGMLLLEAKRAAKIEAIYKYSH